MRKRLVPLALLAALVALLPAGIARASGGDPSSAMASPPALPAAPAGTDASGKAGSGRGDTFTFYGSGWGHGVGMSQWGAYGLARQGWSSTRILTHYFSHTSVGGAPSGAPDVIRVGLAWDRSSLHLTAQAGPVALRFGKPTAPDKHTIPGGSTWTVRPDAAGHFRLVNASGTVIDTLGGPRWRMFAAYTQNHAQLRIPEASHSYGRGYVEFNTYRPHGSWLIRAVGVLAPDEYLYGLGEVPSSWPMAAMEAQATAGRTYALYVEAHAGLHRVPCNCGVYPNSTDQAYIGWDKESDSFAPSWRQAVNQTSGKVVLYGGAAALTNYYSSSGGYTESNENVWFTSTPVPYLRSVCDPGDYAAPDGLRIWRESLSQSQVSASIDRISDVGTVTGFRTTRSQNSGRILSITVNGTGRSASVQMPGPTFSSVLGLLDDKVWIDQNRNIEGAIRARYDSTMCAPGLAMAPVRGIAGGQVQRFADGSIYVNPAVHATVWLHGDVYAKYLSLGGGGSVLGLPRTNLIVLTTQPGCGGGGCFAADFDHGRIYDKDGIGAHEIHGPVLAYYRRTGGANGSLGFPTSDVQHLSGGATRSTFQHGTVTCPSSGACTRS
jgi:SpoIID/LytB domain protein